MSPPDRHPVSEAPPPAAHRRDGAEPRSRGQRLLMLGTLTAISLAVAVPVVVVTAVFGQRPGPKPPPPAGRASPAPGHRLSFSLRHSLDWLAPGTPANPPGTARPTPADADGLLDSLQRSANQLLPAAQSLGPDPITVAVRPEHVAARLEKVRRQAARFGGTATEGVPNGSEKVLFVDLPATATAAFRLAVTTNAPVDAASPAPPAAPAGSPDHIEVIIQPAADDD